MEWSEHASGLVTPLTTPRAPPEEHPPEEHFKYVWRQGLPTQTVSKPVSLARSGGFESARQAHTSNANIVGGYDRKGTARGQRAAIQREWNYRSASAKEPVSGVVFCKKMEEGCAA